MLYLACASSSQDLQELFHPNRQSDEVKAQKDAAQLKEQASSRQRLFSALDTRFHTETLRWRDCGGAKTNGDFSGPVTVQLSSPPLREDDLGEVLGYCDGILRANAVEKVRVGPGTNGNSDKYHVVPPASIPDSLELMAPLTVDYIRHKQQFGETADADVSSQSSHKTPPAPVSHELSPVDKVIADSLITVQQPLMNNLLAAFERNKLKYPLVGEMVFDEAIVRLTMGYKVDSQIKLLHDMAGQEDASKCQADKCKNLALYLQLLVDDEVPTGKQAKANAEMLVKTMPDDPYREKALYFLAQRSNIQTLPGMNDSDSEKNLWHSVTVIALMVLLLLSSPVFALILLKWLLEKRNQTKLPVGVTNQAALSEVTYGWKRIWSVIVFLLFTIVLVFGFEWTIGAVSELENILLAIRNPISSAMYELIESTLFNSTVFFVYLLYCLPKGIGFREAFGLRLSTKDYSFKRLVGLGIVAYLALNLVTSATMVLMLVFHHPETPADQSASVARVLSLGAGGIYFFTESILGPLMEELCFRGVLYRGLRYSWGVLPSLIVSSLWFAVLHGQLAPWLLFHKFAVGAVNALLYEKTKSLTPAVIAHALNNMFLDLF